MEGLEVNVVGIDPSFTRTGIAILTKDKKIIFHTLSEKIGKKDFMHVYDAAYSLSIQLRDYLDQFKPYIAVMEYAPPISSMSPALYSLDSLYHFVLHGNLVRLYHPMTLVKIVGKKGRTKADSVMKGLSIIEDLKKDGWSLSQNRKPCHDCFEAFLYAHYYIDSGEIKIRENKSVREGLPNKGKKNADTVIKKEVASVSCKEKAAEDKKPDNGHEQTRSRKAGAKQASAIIKEKNKNKKVSARESNKNPKKGRS